MQYENISMTQITDAYFQLENVYSYVHLVK